jgi:hypothetical protein
MSFPIITNKLRDLATLDEDVVGGYVGDCSGPDTSNFLGHGPGLALDDVGRQRICPCGHDRDLDIFSFVEV